MDILESAELMKTIEKMAAKAKPTKHKGGRPKVIIKRESHVKVRMTATDRLMVNAKAKAAGMLLSDWIRASARSAKVVARLTPDDLQILRMLAGLANNLNQLTRLAHQEGILTIARRCDALLREIDQAFKIL